MRRGLFILALVPMFVAGVPAGVSSAQEDIPWRHALSLIDTPKYPADFKHFDYVNPEAPKGGVARFSYPAAFDSLNPVLVTKGIPAPALGLIFETLMTGSMDESSTEYGLLAEAVRFPPDYAWVTYRLRDGAKWHDGKPVTVDDVIWSFEEQKKPEINPNVAAYYSHVTKVEKTGDREVTFTFDAPGNRELPQIIGQLTVLPKHYYEGTDAKGRKRSLGDTTLEVPLGSGPYKVKSVDPGRSITYERVPDYWGKDLPVNVGSNNFDELRYSTILDQTVALQAFSGDQYDWRFENSAKNWATGYDFPARKDGRVIQQAIPDPGRGTMQAFVVNLRRDRFKDSRVRLALNYAFDFETMNRTIFYGQYQRDNSFFAGTELASSGLPQGKELEILETVRGSVPEEVFTTPFQNPVGGDTTKVRDNLRKAVELFAQAGWVFKGGTLVNEKTGEPFVIEFLYDDPNFTRVILPYAQSLGRIGVQVTPRLVDSQQMEKRQQGYDYDMITFNWPQSLSPGNEQRYFWGSATADQPGAYNFAGIKDPAVDKLIERVIFAKDREELIAATRALDRVLLWNHYVIPQWFYGKFRTARWDRFGQPDPLPKYQPGFPTVWWYDKDKAAKIGRAPQ